MKCKFYSDFITVGMIMVIIKYFATAICFNSPIVISKNVYIVSSVFLLHHVLLKVL